MNPVDLFWQNPEKKEETDQIHRLKKATSVMVKVTTL